MLYFSWLFAESLLHAWWLLWWAFVSICKYEEKELCGISMRISQLGSSMSMLCFGTAIAMSMIVGDESAVLGDCWHLSIGLTMRLLLGLVFNVCTTQFCMPCLWQSSLVMRIRGAKTSCYTSAATFESVVRVLMMQILCCFCTSAMPLELVLKGRREEVQHSHADCDERIVFKLILSLSCIWKLILLTPLRAVKHDHMKKYRASCDLRKEWLHCSDRCHV